MDKLQQSLTPLVKISNFFGFFPYTVKPDGKLEQSWLQVGYIITLFSIMDYFLYLRIIHINEYTQQGSFLAQIATILIVLLIELFILISLILNVVNRSFLEKFLRDLWKFDEEVSFFSIFNTHS
jgi:hypothetical protein